MAYAENNSALVGSAGSAIVLLTNQKDYEHFNKVWREIVRLWCIAFAKASAFASVFACASSFAIAMEDRTADPRLRLARAGKSADKERTRSEKRLCKCRKWGKIG